MTKNQPSCIVHGFVTQESGQLPLSRTEVVFPHDLPVDCMMLVTIAAAAVRFSIPNLI